MATYYVRPDGNDSNTGSGPDPSSAWQTFGKAMFTVTNGDTVYFAPGSYTSDTAELSGAFSYTNITLIGDRHAQVFSDVEPGNICVYGIAPGGNQKSYCWQPTFSGCSIKGMNFLNEYSWRVGSTPTIFEECEFKYFKTTAILEQATNIDCALELLLCDFVTTIDDAVWLQAQNIDFAAIGCTLRAAGGGFYLRTYNTVGLNLNVDLYGNHFIFSPEKTWAVSGYSTSYRPSTTLVEKSNVFEACWTSHELYALNIVSGVITNNYFLNMEEACYSLSGTIGSLNVSGNRYAQLLYGQGAWTDSNPVYGETLKPPCGWGVEIDYPSPGDKSLYLPVPLAAKRSLKIPGVAGQPLTVEFDIKRTYTGGDVYIWLGNQYVLLNDILDPQHVSLTYTPQSTRAEKLEFIAKANVYSPDAGLIIHSLRV